MHAETDEILVSRVATGDRAAYARLVDRHASRFLAVAERVLLNRAAAEDALQDSFVKLWSHAGRFDAAQAKFTTWFYRIVVNRCLDETRRVRPDALPDGFDRADDRPDAEEVMAAAQKAAAIRDAMARLPDRQRAALVLTYYEGLKNAEAAALLDVGVKALESLLVRARANLAKDLADLIRN